MARRKAAPRGRGSERRGGGTLFGVMAGVVLGLLAAAAVAIYITGAPMPFVDRASRGPDLVPTLPHGVPDPNRGLSSAGILPAPGLVAPSVPAPPSGSATAPATPGSLLPGAAAPGRPPPDALGAFVANLGNGAAGAAAGGPPAASATPPAIPTAPAGRYILQVGAFRVIEDAEALKAQLALLGFEARVSQALVNGVLLNRVQVGPYANLEALNQARERLTANRVESTVVRN